MLKVLVTVIAIIASIFVSPARSSLVRRSSPSKNTDVPQHGGLAADRERDHHDIISMSAQVLNIHNVKSLQTTFNLSRTKRNITKRTGCDPMLAHREGVAECGIEHATVGECGSNWSSIPQSDIGARHNLFPGARVIVDIGGNVGEDLQAFVQRFPQAQIFTFEPVPEFYNHLKAYYGSNPNVHIYNYGVSDADRWVVFNVDGAATSGLNSTGQGERVKVHLRDISTILAEVRQKAGGVLDVVSMNCEGCEYVALHRMYSAGWLGTVPTQTVPFVQISWHIVDGVSNRLQSRCAIERGLANSYSPVYHSYFGWQGWKQRQ